MVDVIGRAKVVVEGVVDTGSVAASGGKIGDVLKKGALVGGAALAGLAAAGVETYLAFEEAEAQSRKLNRVLENMGEGQATEAVEKLADELMRLTGIDDEVIKGGQTILATFDSVNDSAGEVGGTFDRATRAAVDMSTIFGSVESASRAVGRALEDPTKAAALLRRANVILNDEQKQLIENFAAAGDTAGAQDVILSALEERYKGTAETASKESQKIGTAFGELKETVGGLVADMITSLSGDGKKKKGLSGSIYEVNDAVDTFAKSASWKQLQGNIRTTSNLIGKIVGPAEQVFKWFDKLEKKSPELAGAIKFIIDPLRTVKVLLEGIADAWEAVSDFFDRGGPDFSSGARDLTADDLLGPGAAVGGPRSGLTLVGERGPEIVNLPNGSYVHNAANTERMLANAAGGNVINYWQFYGPESLSQARRDEDWSRRYGTRFGAATTAGAR